MLALALCLALAPSLLIDGEDVAGWSTSKLWERADQCFHDGRYQEAIRLQQRIVELDPQDVNAYTVAAWLTWSLGNEPAARHWLVRCVQANPRSWESHFELGYHLYERVGDAAAALPHLKEALRWPPYPDPVLRTLAHAYLTAELPHYAVAQWRQIAAAGRAPEAILATNLPKAVAAALRSDAQARTGGALDGLRAAGKAPIVLADQRTDGDGDGFAEHRVLDLDDPDHRDGRPDFRILYLGHRVIKRTYWDWQSIYVDTNRNGSFADEQAITDPDHDGIAEPPWSLAEWRARRAGRSAGRARFSAPDRYEIGLGESGQAVPWTATVTGAAVALAPPVLVASDRRGLRLRARLVETVRRQEVTTAESELPGGVYCANDPAGSEPRVGLALRPDPAPERRCAVVVELLLLGAVLDRKVLATQVVVTGGSLSLAAPWPWEPAAALLPPPEAMPEAVEAGPEPQPQRVD